MRPDKYDRKHQVLIEGAELRELKQLDLAESFGLDRRIERYQGKRPLGLYRWDLEGLLAALSSTFRSTRWLLLATGEPAGESRSCTIGCKPFATYLRACSQPQHQVIPEATHALTDPKWDELFVRVIVTWFGDL